jgi:hypothetical protein
MRKNRDLLDYISLIGGFIATGFAIYFYYERYRSNKMNKRTPIKSEEDKKDQIGVIID